MTWFHIAIRELRALLGTVMGWLVLGSFLLVFGALWCLNVFVYLTWSEELSGAPGTQQLLLSDNLITPLYSSMILIFVFVCPAISMRLFSEDYKQHTIELLLTAPISTSEIVLGKFAGAMGFITLMLLSTMYAPVFLWVWVPHDLSPFIGSYIGLWLLSAALISMGMWFSSSTSNQIAALIPSFAAGLGLYLLSFMGSDSSLFFEQLAMGNHLTEFFRGIIQLSDVSYFVCFTSFFLLATHQRVQAYRWR
jgi:ABC-2 type transport system permease protein